MYSETIGSKYKEEVMKKTHVSKLLVAALCAVFLIAAAGLFAETKGGAKKTTVMGWETILEDSFETFDFPEPWERTGTNYTWGQSDVQASDGTYSIWCADKNLGGNPQLEPKVGSGYANNMEAWLDYGPFDLRNCNDALMSFDIWRKLSDQDKVEIIAYNNVKTATVIYTGGQGGWFSEEISFGNWNGSSFLGNKDVYVRLRFYSNGAGTDIGAFIDNVVIQKDFAGWPDVAVSALGVNVTDAVSGEEILVEGSTTNLSDNKSQANKMNFYLSADRTFSSADDVCIGSLPIPGLEKDEVSSFSESFFVPVTLDPGSYYLIGVVDPNNVMNEEDKDNNVYVTGSPMSITQPVGWEAILFDDFEDPFPETYGWERYADVGNYTWSREPGNAEALTGDYSLWCAAKSYGAAPGLEPADGYAALMSAYATYGKFDLVNAVAADLSMHTWYEMGPTDKMEVLINAGSGWEGYQFEGNSGGWTYVQLDLTDWPVYGNLLGYSNITFALHFISSANIPKPEGAFVDNVVIRKQTTSAVGENDKAIPEVFELNQNYPNPFNPQTSIAYSLPRDADVTLTIYNIFGQKVRTVVDQKVKAGYHTVQWDGVDTYGSKVASGVYFYKISAGTFTAMKKMILVE